MRTIRSKVMSIANKLVKEGYKRAWAMVKAWALVKKETIKTKTAGVTVGKRQEALEHLKNYKKEDIKITLKREKDNQYDKNALAVIVSVRYKGNYRVGYIPKALASFIAPLVDAGKEIKALFEEVRGGEEIYLNYGLVISLSI